ncbi:hypothetical protein KP509_06G067400 [Ceratopteris richardii]|uniref:Uncharacterized protein n=1 Tax=Ceratopteris richardii TaxID=49495 RepID=A0A8T2UPP1_CERRI|nr:hypothetical protein KP509_06G067400 [Ceratopteris richardii]
MKDGGVDKSMCRIIQSILQRRRSFSLTNTLGLIPRPQLKIACSYPRETRRIYHHYNQDQLVLQNLICKQKYYYL